MHLSELPGEVDAASLAPVLDRLAAYKPDLITIEAMPGDACDAMARHTAVYDAASLSRFCPDTAAARAATGLDVPSAMAEADRQLRNWPQQPTAAQRRKLASLFLAAGEPTSALVQWWHLGAAERRAGDGLDDTLVEALRKRETAQSENEMIAARLAVRLGLQRVHPVDDHTGDGGIHVDDPAAYGKAIQAAWDNPLVKQRGKEDAAAQASGDMLAYYRLVNDADYLQRAVESDFGAALREPSPQHFGRLYVAGWETRNLRMVANIRAAFAEQPGARLLSIVGATHKSWFDSLLGQLQGVEIVDARQVLR